jgi:CDGSH-type Zn-finger protein
MALPKVFNVQRRPWVDVDAADADRIAEAVEGCPTAALRYERLDGEPGEMPDSPTLVIPVPNGPLFMRGRLRVETPAGELIAEATRLALCRCGESANKPFCDNSHLAIGFRSGSDDALPRPAGAAETPPGDGVTTVVPRDDASLRVRGDLRLVSLRGELLGAAHELFLCRCGHSSSKPLCDGTHERVGIHGTEPVIPAGRETAESPAAFEPNPV